MKLLLRAVGLSLICSCAQEVPKKIVVDEQLMSQMANHILSDSAAWGTMLPFLEHLSDEGVGNLDLNQLFTFDDSVAISNGRSSLIFYCMVNIGAMSSNDLNKERLVRYYSTDHEEEILDCLERSYPAHCERFTKSDFLDKTYLLGLEGIPGNEKLEEFQSYDHPRPYFCAYGIEESNIICLNIGPTPMDDKKFGPFFGSSYFACFILNEALEEIIFFGSSYRVQ